MQGKNLSNKADYQQARTDEFIWQRAKALGMPRRKFIRLMTFGTGWAAASLSGIYSHKYVVAEQTVFKPIPLDFFYDHGIDKEMRWSAMYNRGYLVPRSCFTSAT